MEGLAINDDVREIVLAATGLIPGGGVLTTFITVIWKPEKEDVWTTIQGRVEEVVSNKIIDNNCKTVKEELRGLKGTLEALDEKPTEDKWSALFTDLKGRTYKVLATDHDKDHQLFMLPQAALFGVIFTKVWKLGKSKSWSTSSDKSDTKAVRQFYEDLKKSASDRYQGKIEELKGNSNKSKAWEDIAKIHNMLVLDVHPLINLIDKLLNDTKEEISNKYEIYSPPIGNINHDLHDLPLPQFRGTIIKELIVKHDNDGVYGWHIRYSDRSENSINSRDIGTEYRLDLAGKYISKIDFYSRSDVHNDFGYETIKKVKIYVVDFANENNSIPPIELGSQDTSNCKHTEVNNKDWCVLWIAGNPEPIRDEVQPFIGAEASFTSGEVYYYYTGLRIGFIPISEYKKLFVPEKRYYIVNKNSFKFLDVAGGSTNSGGRIQQYRHNGTQAQEWLFEDVGNGYFYIVNKKSGKVLNVAGGRTQNGADVIQYDKKDEDGSKWRFQEVDDGYFYILSKLNEEFALEVPNAWTHDEANIQMYKKNLDADCQKWQFMNTEDYRKVIESRYT